MTRPPARSRRRARLADSPTVNGMVGVAVVGLVHHSPRLALRAARVVLEDSYAAHFSTAHRHDGRGSRVRSRGAAPR